MLVIDDVKLLEQVGGGEGGWNGAIAIGGAIGAGVGASLVITQAGSAPVATSMLIAVGTATGAALIAALGVGVLFGTVLYENKDAIADGAEAVGGAIGDALGFSAGGGDLFRDQTEGDLVNYTFSGS